MRAMRYALLGAVLVVSGATSAPTKPEPAEEVKWAKGIADDFWRAVLESQAEQAAGLLSAELSKSLVSYAWSGAGEGNRVMERPAGHWLESTLPSGPKVSVTFDSQELSPGRDEVVFKGQLRGKDKEGDKVAADFTMRIAREGGGGKWSIRYLLVTDRKGAETKDR